MDNVLTVTWATPVDTATFGARLEAYVDSKSVITTFRACLRCSCLPQLPEEVILKITSHVQQVTFLEHLEDWEQGIRCCTRKCDMYDHLSSEAITTWRSVFCEKGSFDERNPRKQDYKFREYVEGETDYAQGHEDNLEIFWDRFRGSRSFAKYMSVRTLLLIQFGSWLSVL